ncbi:hypothetical protein K449DRAFT_36815 [Hypoxylon sp. EC38]|nr:hypothetical protein K449DRAFT_36815 [Hypoxylon sp. EC38]
MDHPSYITFRGQARLILYGIIGCYEKLALAVTPYNIQKKKKKKKKNDGGFTSATQLTPYAATKPMEPTIDVVPTQPAILLHPIPLK